MKFEKDEVFKCDTVPEGCNLVVTIETTIWVQDADGNQRRAERGEIDSRWVHAALHYETNRIGRILDGTQDKEAGDET